MREKFYHARVLKLTPIGMDGRGIKLFIRKYPHEGCKTHSPA